MSSRTDTIRQTILADHAASMEIFNNLTTEQWEKPVPSDEGAQWKARDVLAHLAVSEEGQLGQITRLLAGGVTVPDDFDLNRFNRRSVQKQADKSVEDLLKDIRLGHAKVVAGLNSIAEEELDKSGRHARGDVISVEAFFMRITEHRRQHAEQLQKAVNA
ncbi:MAG: DinB family protein [Chloroflexi bacterium]|nr:DinB family protein [Chloroflexota bacterium]